VVGRKLFVPLFALLLLAAGCGSVNDAAEPGETAAESGVTRQIAGNWKGKLQQEGLPPFEIAVDIGPDSTGEVAYTGIKCGGDWTLDRVKTSIPPLYTFTEQINQGAGGTCKGTGTASITPIQDTQPNEPAYNRLNYSFTGGGVTSSGVLHRTDPESLKQVFRQAGVTPP
jgi:hypothetical protein